MKDNKGGVVQNKKKPSLLLRIVCIFLAILVVFGIVMGTIAIVRGARAVAKAGNITVEEGVANYFASQFKITYIAALKGDGVKGVEDTSEFWARKDEDGKSYGERLESEFKVYLSEIIAGNIIFDNYGELSGGDEAIIERTIASTLKWRADNSKDEFNSMAEKYGFDYDDFCKAAELLYKAERAQEIIYGSDGKNLDSTLAEEYYENYTHVSLAFIRTDYKRKLNSSTGLYEYEEIDSIEKAQRLAKIAELRGYIDNIKTGEGDIMTALTFREIENDYEGDPDVEFYFSRTSVETAIFAEDFEGVVEMSYKMKDGEFAYVECNVPADPETGYRGFVGTCFIYRTADNTMPYLDNDNTFFSDFYTNAADYYYSQNLKEFARDVEFTKRYEERIDPVSVPVNNELCIMGWEI